MSPNKKAPAWFIQHVHEAIAAVLDSPRANPELVSGIARLAIEERDKLHTKHRSGRKPGSAAAVTKHIRARALKNPERFARWLFDTYDKKIIGAMPFDTFRRHVPGGRKKNKSRPYRDPRNNHRASRRGPTTDSRRHSGGTTARAYRLSASPSLSITYSSERPALSGSSLLAPATGTRRRRDVPRCASPEPGAVDPAGRCVDRGEVRRPHGGPGRVAQNESERSADIAAPAAAPVADGPARSHLNDLGSPACFSVSLAV